MTSKLIAMKLLFLFSLLLLISPHIYPQSDSTVYFDNDLQPVKEKHAVFKGIKSKKDSLVELHLYNKEGDYKILIAHYTDETFKVMEGSFLSFYRNGNVENKCNFHNGQMEGLFVRWTADQKISDSIWYKAGDPVYKITYTYNKTSGKLEAVTRSNLSDSTSTKTRFDENGNMIRPDYTDSLSKADDSIYAKTDSSAEFPGGDASMLQYFEKRLNEVRGKMLITGSSGFCMLRLLIDKTGRVVNAVSPACDNNMYASAAKFAAMQMIWLPAIVNGRSVKAYKNITLTYYPSIPVVLDKNTGKYFFDADMNPVIEDKAVLYGKVATEYNMVRLDVYNKAQKKLLFSEHFTDSTLSVANGPFYSEYSNGVNRVYGNFLLGRKDGAWIARNESEQVTDSLFYKIGELTSVTSFSYEPDGTLLEAVTVDPATSEVRNRFFNDGVATEDTLLDVLDKAKKIYKKTDVPAAFPGGSDAWAAYMSNYNHHHDTNVFSEGTCVVRFIIDTSGKVSHVLALTMQGSSLANFAEKMIRRSPDWIPAMQDGVKVASYFYQRITMNIFRSYTPVTLPRTPATLPRRNTFGR